MGVCYHAAGGCKAQVQVMRAGGEAEVFAKKLFIAAGGEVKGSGGLRGGFRGIKPLFHAGDGGGDAGVETRRLRLRA